MKVGDQVAVYGEAFRGGRKGRVTSMSCPTRACVAVDWKPEDPPSVYGKTGDLLVLESLDAADNIRADVLPKIFAIPGEVDPRVGSLGEDIRPDPTSETPLSEVTESTAPSGQESNSTPPFDVPPGGDDGSGASEPLPRDPLLPGRTIETHRAKGCNKFLDIEITVVDAPGPGGANHRYDITGYDSRSNPSAVGQDGYSCHHSRTVILFQNGPIKEVGINGVTNEALLAILIDRMEGFQRGEYACDENQSALDAMREAHGWLNIRTTRLLNQGIEGTHAKDPV